MATGDHPPTQTGDRVLLRQFERMDALRGFWYEHHAEFLERYRGQFIAVKDPLGDYEVVASDKRIGVLVEAVDAMGLDRQGLGFKLITDEARAPMPVLLKHPEG